MHDVREILRMAEAGAPPARYSVDDIVAAGRRRRRRALGQRLGGAGVVAAALATVTVLATVNLALPADDGLAVPALPAARSPAPTTPPASPPFTFTFAGYQVDDYRVLPPDEVNLVYQTAGVLRDGIAARGKPSSQYVATLTVYQPRMFDPEQFAAGTRLTVRGRDAFQADIQRPLAGWSVDQQVITIPGTGTATGTVTAAALAWQYAPDAWAVLASEVPVETFPLADAVRLAERFAIAPGDPIVAKVPFRTGYLPAGFTLRSVSGQSLTAENRGMVTFVYAKPQPSSEPPAAARDSDNDSTATSVVISILWIDTPPPDAVERTSRCNPGQHWCATTLPGGEFYVAVEDPSETLSDDELLRISDALTFADIKDAATWYPAV